MSAGFSGSLQLDFGDWGNAGRIAIILQPILWDDGHGFACIIPAGTMTDGATLPRPFWWFLPPWGDLSTLAAILHDYLCEQLDMGEPVNGCDTREKCDQQFYRALKALGVNGVVSAIAWLGVRFGSTFLWHPPA